MQRRETITATQGKRTQAILWHSILWHSTARDTSGPHRNDAGAWHVTQNGSSHSPGDSSSASFSLHIYFALSSFLCLLRVFGLDELWLWTWPLSAPSPPTPASSQGIHSKFLKKNLMAQCICLDINLILQQGDPQIPAGLNRALGSLPWMSVLPWQLAYAKLFEASVPSILSLSLLGWWLCPYGPGKLTTIPSRQEQDGGMVLKLHTSLPLPGQNLSAWLSPASKLPR